jgi:hypothetical protein
MIPRSPVYYFLLSKFYCKEGSCSELLHAMECFEPTFIDVQQLWYIIFKVRLLKSQTNICTLLEDILTLRT